MRRTVRLFFSLLATMWLGQSPSGALAQDAHWVELFGTTISLQAADSDSDGILDLRELFLGTASDETDSDGDGFSDLFEDSYRRFGFDPLFFTQDTDSDGLSDEYEASHGPDIDSVDTDGDGWSDFDEVMNAPFGYDPLLPTEDYDFDGVADELEVALGLSPDRPDTNRDGVSDFQVLQAGLDPEGSFPDGLGEIVGTTYSKAMERALRAVRRGRDFPPRLAAQLPYPAVTTRLYGDPSTELPPDGDGPLPQPDPPSVPVRVSSALLQQSVQNRPYPSYNEIVAELAQIADYYDGTPGPEIVRLFRWSERTNDGRFIYSLKISDNPDFNESEPEVLFMGLHHGQELVAASIPMALLRRITSAYEAGNRAMVGTVNRKEIWIIPVVNPDGYSMAIGELGEGANVAWRKNTRLVVEEEWPPAQTPTAAGVDLNRNYGFEHVRSFSESDWSTLTNPEVNGFIDLFGSGIHLGSTTYAGESAFTDVETQAVRGLANNEFGPGNSEIHAVACSLSWHTRGGVVIHPMNHPTANGLNPADRPELARLADVVAFETGYRNTLDTWWTESNGYAAYGTSDDWLYKEKGVLAITVEAYSAAEHDGDGPDFFPVPGAKRSELIRNNVRGAQRFMCICGGSCRAVIQPLP